MKIRFIINPVSGTGKQEGIDQLIKKHLTNFEFEIVYTKKKGDATQLSKKAVNDGIDAVVAVGGDGTVNECAKALINTNTALGIIPCGSGNGFAYHFGIKKNLEQAVIQLKYSNFRIIDSCSVNHIPFVNVSGIGFDAHIGNLFAYQKKRGFVNYLKLIINEISYKENNYTLEYEDKKRSVKAFLIAFANASQYGNDAHISPLSDISDGLIDFIIVKKFPKWKIPLILFMIARGKTHLSQYVEIIQTTKMKIESINCLTHLDGEPYTFNSPIIVKIHPKTLKIFTQNVSKKKK